MNKCIILGAGYSIKPEWKTGLFEKIKDCGCEIWSINSIYKIMPYLPDRQLFVDSSFFRNNQEQIKQMTSNGVKVIAKGHKLIVDSKLPIKTFDTTRNPKEYFGVEAIKKKKLFSGGNGLSGFFALSYATALEYDEIYLLGYDFGTPQGEANTHCYQEEMKEYSIISAGAGRPQVYMQSGKPKRTVRDFDVYKNNKSRIFNVSLKSNIQSFEKMSYEEFYERLRPAPKD